MPPSLGLSPGCRQNVCWVSAGGPFTSRFTHLVVGKIQFFMDWRALEQSSWTENLSSSLAVGLKLPLVACYLCLSLGQLITWQLAFSEWESENKKWYHQDGSHNPVKPSLISLLLALFHLLEANH